MARWDGSAKVDKGLRRWAAVARSAARQSRRAYIPDVTELVSTAQLVSRVRAEATAGTAVLALHESASQRLTDVALSQVDSVMLIIGPEGGIADEEIAALRDAGAFTVRLGPTVLRTSTANWPHAPRFIVAGPVLSTTSTGPAIVRGGEVPFSPGSGS